MECHFHAWTPFCFHDRFENCLSDTRSRI